MKNAYEPDLGEMLDETAVAGRAEIEESSALALRFFRFESHPFADNVNPRFFYRTEAHERAFMAMKRCIEDDVSLGLTTAVSGTGKTLLTQVLLQELDPARYRPALVLVYPRMSRTALLEEIACELGVEIPGKRPTLQNLIAGIQQAIMEMYLHGVKPVVIIDEVHFLTPDNLQVLRTLSNIETPEKKLVTILLFGEDSFHEKIDKPAFKSVLSRMFTRVRLRPLSGREIEQYVKYRLLLVGGDPSLFAPACFAWLEEQSLGVPREINRICHNALQTAALRGERRVGRATLQELES